MAANVTRPSAADVNAARSALLALGGSVAAPELRPIAKEALAGSGVRSVSPDRRKALPVLKLSAAQLARGLGLGSARRAGWHFLVEAPGESVAAEVRRKGRRGARAVVVLSGPLQDALAK